MPNRQALRFVQILADVNAGYSRTDLAGTFPTLNAELRQTSTDIGSKS
jgi:hypothetical protein